MGWSVVIGAVSTALSVPFGGVGADGPGVGIAAWTEEALKLVPLAVLAVAAPRRVSRFAVADWVLLGIASGAAFLAVEEYLRRTAYASSGGGLFGLAIEMLADLGRGDGLPDAFVRFGLWILPAEAQNSFGTSAGHLVATATVTAGVGLAIAAARQLERIAPSDAAPVGTSAGASTRPSAGDPVGPVAGGGSRAGRWAAARRWGVVTALLPLAALMLAVYDHAGWNASAATGDRWLDGSTSTAPLAMRLTWSLTGHGTGREVLLFVLVASAVCADAARYARAHRLAGRGDVDGGPPVPAPAAGNALVAAGAAGWRQLVGDLRFAAAARARQDGEGRLVAVARGRVAANMCRTQRELLVELARGDRPVSSYRRAGWVALAVLAAGAFVAGPLLAVQIGPSLDGAWLAGQLEALGSWFSGLSFGQQIVVGVGIAALVALSGGSLGLAFGVSGVATYLLAHGQGAGAFVRDPRSATRSYLTTRSPAEMAWDALETVLTFAPGNFAGAAGGRWVRAGVDDFAQDPAAWRAGRREALRGEAGEVDLAPFLHRGGVGQWADPAVQRQWVADRYVDPNVGNAGMRRPLASSEDWAVYQARVAGDQEIRLVPLTNDLDPIWADGVRVDPDGVVAVDAKFVDNPDGRSMYEGGRPDFLLDDFVDELERYAAVIVDSGNPVVRLEVVTSTQAAKDFLTTWAAAKIAPFLGDLDVADVLTVTLVPRPP